jgi:hypothetical protein
VTLPCGGDVWVPLASPDPNGDRLAIVAILERTLHEGISFGPAWHRWLREA